MRSLTLNATDGLQLHVSVFDHEAPKAVMQVTHGACEHKELYYPFAEYLNRHGYAVVLSDNRGHGDSISEQYPYGHIEGIGQFVADSYEVTKMIKKDYPGRDLYLFGHSLGSVIVRNYLQDHDDEITKLILTGTANYIRAVPIGLIIGRLCRLFGGKYGHSRLFDRIGGSTIYSKTPYDKNWVTTDRTFYKEFTNDPKTQFAWDNSGALTVFEGDWNLKRFKKFQCKNPELQIYSFTGGRDPIVGGKEGLADTVASLKKIGYRNIYTKVYPEDLHAVLFEQNRLEVYEDILMAIDE